jgi:hypothetical protein
MPYPSSNWHIPLNCVFFKVLRYEDVLKQAMGCVGQCFPKLAEKIDQGLALLHLVLRNSANPCQAFWVVWSLLDPSWRELFLLLQLVRCWVLYDIVSYSVVEVLCFSREKNESPPLNNPLTTREIVRKKTQHQKLQQREAVRSGTWWQRPAIGDLAIMPPFISFRVLDSRSPFMDDVFAISG